MSKATILICAVTLLIVAGLALGTRAPTPATPVESNVRPGIEPSDTRDAPRTQPRPEHVERGRLSNTTADSAETVAETLAPAIAINAETSEAYPTMPWIERDDREVAEEIASNAQRTGSRSTLPLRSSADIRRLHELVPELAEDATNGAVDIAELVDDPDVRPLPPGTAVRPGAYFEPAEDEED